MLVTMIFCKCIYMNNEKCKLIVIAWYRLNIWLFNIKNRCLNIVKVLFLKVIFGKKALLVKKSSNSPTVITSDKFQMC